MSSFKTPVRFALIALAAFALSGCGGSDLAGAASVATGTINCKYTFSDGTGFCYKLYNVDVSQAAAICTAAGYTVTTTCPSGWTQY